MKKQIKFRAQYLYLVSEIIDNAFFLNRKFEKVCFVDSGIFSSKSQKLVKQSFPNADIISVKDVANIKAKHYDLVLMPMAVQFLQSLKYDVALLHDSLKSGGVLLASGFNVLSSSDSILPFKEYLQSNKLRPSLVNFFSLGRLLNTFLFKDKTLDRENLIVLGNKIELINVFCQKQSAEKTTNSIKIMID